MHKEGALPEFTPEQWAFLAALEACGDAVALDAARAMAPLSPAQLDRLVRGCERAGWIARGEDGRIGLTRDVPETVRYDLKLLNGPARTARLLDRLRAAGLADRLSRRAMIKLLTDAGRAEQAAEIEVAAAHDFLERRDHEQAYQHMSRAVGMLHGYIMGGGDGRDRVFVEAALELSSLSFAVGRGMQVLASYLRTAVTLAGASGNARSHALARLHLGRLLAYLDQRAEAMEMLRAGKEEVERLGDADILQAAAEFLGLYFMMQGRFRDALAHFERAEEQFTREGDRLLVYPMILWSLGITLFAAGQVPRALGFFQGYWRSAREMGLPAVASIARAILGFSLAVVRKRAEAALHLDASLEEARENRNAYSLLIARVGLAILAYQDRDLGRSFDLLRPAVVEGGRAASALVLLNFHLLEMLAAFHREGFPPLADGWQYHEQLDACLQEPSLALRGVALRLRAESGLLGGGSAARVLEDLERSRDHLHRAGAVFSLNGTWLAMARLHLREGDRDKARALARRAWARIRGMGLSRELVPEDLRPLLEPEGPGGEERDAARDVLAPYFDLLHGLDGAAGGQELYHRAVRRLGQILGAERGALFGSAARDPGRPLALRAGYNFTRREMDAAAFQPARACVERAFRENRTVRARPELPPSTPAHERILGVLCIPVPVGERVGGVLYYDHAYVDVHFDLFPARWAPMLVEHTRRYAGHLLELAGLREKAGRLSADESIRLERLGSHPILTQSPAMLRVLEQAERAARSDATLLVTGETGTGKELLVSRVHRQSPRAAGPFIVVDAASMPESLVESELFGHEKGAYTGADSRKRGRIELAHGGTLFIDEIGELPLAVQAKLLRALEGKSFYRVGGTQPVKSDFRLVAATHRDLAAEVARGRFRQDLFYRLNVIPIALPPLRERPDDILLLARHFLRQYGSKHGRGGLALTREDEERLVAYPWLGNVRELKNVIERAVALSGGERWSLDLPLGRPGPAEPPPFAGSPTLEEVQRRYIAHVLEKTGGRIHGPGGAAEVLGMKRSTLYTRMYRLGMRLPGR